MIWLCVSLVNPGGTVTSVTITVLSGLRSEMRTSPFSSLRKMPLESPMRVPSATVFLVFFCQVGIIEIRSINLGGQGGVE